MSRSPSVLVIQGIHLHRCSQAAHLVPEALSLPVAPGYPGCRVHLVPHLPLGLLVVPGHLSLLVGP